MQQKCQKCQKHDFRNFEKKLQNHCQRAGVGDKHFPAEAGKKKLKDAKRIYVPPPPPATLSMSVVASVCVRMCAGVESLTCTKGPRGELPGRATGTWTGGGASCLCLGLRSASAGGKMPVCAVCNINGWQAPKENLSHL